MYKLKKASNKKKKKIGCLRKDVFFLKREKSRSKLLTENKLTEKKKKKTVK
jgi:hypothetical protein